MGSEVDVSFNDDTVMESTGESFEGLDSEVILMDADFNLDFNGSNYLPQENVSWQSGTLNHKEVTTIEARTEGTF